MTTRSVSSEQDSTSTRFRGSAGPDDDVNNVLRPAAAPIVDEILREYADALGSDFCAYRGHVLRVRAFAHELGWTKSDALLQLAAVAHDLGVWTENTIDYLEPSAALADAEAVTRGFDRGDREVLHDLIVNHHKLTSLPTSADAAVEIFRRADWIDVTRGRLRFGLPRQTIAGIRTAMPDNGFAAMLRSLVRRGWRERPWSVPPMLKF